MVDEIGLDLSATKEVRYNNLYPQIEALLAGESDIIANLANVCAALKETFGFFWVGFYLVREDGYVLGPFQGPVACTRIPLGRGVSGAACESGKPLIVPNVDEFPGHIACSGHSRSEIVVPMFRNGELFAALDVDSDKLDDFDEVDAKWLDKIGKLID